MLTSTVCGGNIAESPPSKVEREGGDRMFLNLKAEMVRNSVTATDISRVTQKTDKSIRNKINGIGDFTLSEAYAIRDAFFPKLSIEYLFEKSVNLSRN